MKVRGEFLAVAALASLLIGAAGCGNNETASSENASPAPEASATMGAAEQAGKTLDQAGANVKEGAKEAGENVKAGAKAAGEEVAGAGAAVSSAAQKAAAPIALTPKVKNALAASKDIDASTINVDTLADKKQVVLRGSVPTAAKKALATQIAQKELADAKSDYSVVNQLTVGKK